MAKFSVMLDAYKGEGKLAGVHFQFPATFAYTPKNEDYLRWAVESLEKQTSSSSFAMANGLPTRRWICCEN